MKLILKIGLGVVLAFILMIGGCVAIIGIGLNNEDNEDSVSLEEFDSFQNGMTFEQIKEVAKISDCNVSMRTETYTTYDCEGNKSLTFVSLTFENDVLVSKLQVGLE